MTNVKIPMNKEFDLEERTARFGEDVIRFCRDVTKNEIIIPLINQLVKCGTSTGANYCEADDAESRKDFKQKLAFARKNRASQNIFLRMLAIAVPTMADKARILWKEANELNLIFNAIYRKL